MNPICQDIKNGEVRYLKHGNVLHNYGMIPQTYEDPELVSELCEELNEMYKGDGDPIDIIDIGDKTCEMGELMQVKVLGAVGLIDEGECDWKVIAINVQDERHLRLNTLSDIQGKLCLCVCMYLCMQCG